MLPANIDYRSRGMSGAVDLSTRKLRGLATFSESSGLSSQPKHFSVLAPYSRRRFLKGMGAIGGAGMLASSPLQAVIESKPGSLILRVRGIGVFHFGARARFGTRFVPHAPWPGAAAGRWPSSP